MSDKKNKSVLLVDDEKDILEFFKVSLESSGFEVTSCQNGDRALELVKNKNFDLIILDLMMPGTDGFSVFKTLRSRAETVNVPVLIVSARAGMASSFLSIGADDFIAKPLESSTLIKKSKDLTRDKAILMADSPHVIQSVSKSLDKFAYIVDTVPDEESLVSQGKKNKYKSVIAHLSLIQSDPVKFRETIETELSFKNPSLIIYSDATVKGLETNDTVAIETEITRWKRAGVTVFYDSRTVLRPLGAVFKDLMMI